MSGGTEQARERQEAELAQLKREYARLEAERDALLAAADAARRLAETRAQAVIDQALFSVQILAPDGSVRHVNRAFEAMWGISGEYLSAQGYNLLRDPQLVEKGLMPIIERAFAGEPGDLPLIKYDPAEIGLAGRRCYVEAQIYPVKDADGRIQEVVLVHHDVTARYEAELALRDAAEREHLARALEAQRQLTERIVRHVPVALAYLDNERVYRWSNALHQRLLNRPNEAIIGRHIAEVFSQETLDQIEIMHQRVLETGEPQHLQSVGGLGSSSWDVSYVPVPAEHGQPHGVLMFAVDAAARQQRESWQHEQITQLQELDKLKDQFLSILSHELRTPLNAILGFASILDDELGGPVTPVQRGFLSRIMGGTEILLALINDLLDMSRLQAGKFSLSPRPMRAEEAIQDVAEHLASLAARKNQALELDLPAALPMVRADRQRLAQVLSNLVGNAVKFTPAGGRIEISARAEGPVLRMAVRDDGPGIPLADQPRLFQPFMQLDSSSTRAAGGAGLGLSICKAIVEAHGGAIGLTSAPGEGSTFWFTLPVG